MVQWILENEKLGVAAIIGVSTLIGKYLIQPLFKYIGKRIKRFVTLAENIDALLQDFHPNGGGSTWDKIDRIDKHMTQLHGEHKTALELTRLVASLSGTPLFTADENGDVDWVSTGWVLLTGIDSEHAEGTGWQNAVYSEDRDWLAVAWENAVLGRRDFNETHRIQHDKTGIITAVRSKAEP